MTGKKQMKQILYLEVPTPDTKTVCQWLQSQFEPGFGEKIITPDGTAVIDKEQIKEFIANANTTLITEMQNSMVALRAQAQVKPIKLKATEEQIKKGAPVNFEVPLTFDNSNFFV